jgi:hypothetical protein
LFGPISLNWADKLRLTWEAMLAYIRGATTTTGLAVQAFLHEGTCTPRGRVSDAEMEALNIERHTVCPNWNDAIRPPSSGQATAQADPAEQEAIS